MLLSAPAFAAEPDADVPPAAPGLTPPQLLEPPALEYPAELLGRDEPPTADVVVELTVGVDGVPKELSVIQSADPLLEQYALEYVGGLRYAPATYEGETVEVVLRLTLPFVPPAPPEPEPEVEPPPEDLEPATDDEPRLEDGDEDEGEEPIRIAGTVLEAGQRTPIAGARVVAIPAGPNAEIGAVTKTRYDTPPVPEWEAGTVTDEDGRFELRAIPGGGKVRVIVLAQGYDRIEFVEALPADQAITVRYFAPRLETNPYRTVVTTEAASREEVARRTITAEEISVLPGTQGDALKALQNFPGVARSPLGVGLLVIRGTRPFDSGVFLGGHEMITLFHFGGLTSVFNSDILETIDFIPGNFDSRFGDAIGGVVSVTPRAGRRDGYHGYIDSDVFDTGVLFEGPIGKGSFALAGRRSYIDLLLPAVIPDDAGLDLTVAPRYYDYQVLFDYPLAGGNFSARVFGSDDRTRLVAADPNDIEPDDRNAFETSQFFHRFDLAYEKSEGPWRFLFTPSYRPEYAKFGIGDFFNFDLASHNFSLRSEVERDIGRRSGLRVGTEYVGSWYTADVDALPIPPGPTGSRPNNLVTSYSEAFAIPALYSTLRLGLGESFTLYPGVRAGLYTRPKTRSFVDPRVNFAWNLADHTTLKGGTGLYTQSPIPVEYNAVFGNPRLYLQKAWQNSLSIQQAFDYEISLDATVFYNHIWDLSTTSLELTRHPDGEIGPEIFANTEVGRGYGLEVLLRKQLTGRFFGWVAYTLSRSERRSTPDAQYVPFDADQTHILTLIGVVKLPRGWQTGGRFRLVSGNPMTPLIGGVFDGASDGTGDFYIPIAGNRNSDRLPLFYQLDLRVDKKWTLKRVGVTLYLDVQNVTNRQNTEFQFYSYDFSQSRPVASLPIIPSLGTKIEF